MTSSTCHSKVLAYLDAHHERRYPVKWLRICFASDMLACHGVEYCAWLLEKDDKAQWLDAIRTTERFVDERATARFETEKRKAATWNLPLNTLGGGGQ